MKTKLCIEKRYFWRNREKIYNGICESIGDEASVFVRKNNDKWIVPNKDVIISAEEICKKLK